MRRKICKWKDYIFSRKYFQYLRLWCIIIIGYNIIGMQNKTFLYKGIYQTLRESILSGELGPEDKLPTEDELAQQYSVSKITVKKALELLKEDGLILRVQGRGTFVRRIERPGEKRDAKAPSSLIGLVLEHVSSSFGLNMMYYIDRRLEAAGYKLCIRFTFGSIEKETEEINDLLDMNVAGMIIMPCHDSHYNMTILKLILENFPSACTACRSAPYAPMGERRCACWCTISRSADVKTRRS